MKCDDLQSSECKFSSPSPQFPTSQIHIVMWERLTQPPLTGSPTNTTGIELGASSDPSSVLTQQSVMPALDRKDTEIRDLCSLICEEAKHIEGDKIQCDGANMKQSLYNEANKAMFRLDAASSTGSFPLCVQTDNPKSDNTRATNLPVSARHGHCPPAVRKSSASLASVSKASPCSTSSSSSKISVKLPNFVTVSPQNDRIQRPVPCKQVKTVAQSLNNSPLLDHMAGSQESVKCAISELQTVLAGTIVPIQASTVFCRPVKTDCQVTAKADDKGKIVGDKIPEKDNKTEKLPEEIGLVFENEKLVPETNTDSEATDNKVVNGSELLKHSDVHGKDCITVENSPAVGLQPPVLIGRMKTSETHSQIVYPTNSVPSMPALSIAQPLLAPKAAAVQSLNPTDKNNAQSVSNNSQVKKSGLPFKLPTMLRKKSQNTYVKDAFLTLNLSDKNKHPNNSKGAFPGLNGNISTLSSVKQYLLNRATSRTDCKAKFEGLNLGTYHNKVNKKTTASASVCNGHLGTESVSSLNSASPGFDAFSEGRKKSTMTLDTFDLKRKLEKVNSLIVENDRKKLKSRKLETECSSETNSLKENCSATTQRCGTKKMAFVSKWASKTVTQGEISERDNSLSDLKLNLCKKQETYHQENNSDGVLQDLYDALNIPFDNVKDTMSSIMSDVDDILQFFDKSEILPAQLEMDVLESSRSSPELSQNTWKTDWYVRT